MIMQPESDEKTAGGEQSGGNLGIRLQKSQELLPCAGTSPRMLELGKLGAGPKFGALVDRLRSQNRLLSLGAHPPSGSFSC